MKVRYTRHAEQKFEVLRRHGFEVKKEPVEETLRQPQAVIPQERGRFIAQRTVSDRHLLRVVYREEGETKVVITFYPVRRERYEGRI
ncbi:MAG: DUF4258 domain-containing protein [Candidatus Tectimicrobiota bacterium]|nr:MAG: DUF4258 domain-containing protein [Candidatus Tectomicrobia bacterium]